MSLVRISWFPDGTMPEIVPIASSGGSWPAVLTISRYDEKLGWIFAEDIEGQYCFSMKHENWQMKVGDHSETRVASWIRMEVRVANVRRAARSGFDVVLGRPPAMMWVMSTPLKNPNHKGSIGNQLRSRTFSDENEMKKWIEGRATDCWETGKCLTAGFSIPPDSFSSVKRNYTRGPWYFGLCSDFEQAVRELTTDHRVAELLKRTERGVLDFWPKRTQVPVPDVYKKLRSEVKQEANSLILISIRQALAGPQSSNAWIGRSVLDLADRYYRNYLYNMNRRLITEEIKRR